MVVVLDADAAAVAAGTTALAINAAFVETDAEMEGETSSATLLLPLEVAANDN